MTFPDGLTMAWIGKGLDKKVWPRAGPWTMLCGRAATIQAGCPWGTDTVLCSWEPRGAGGRGSGDLSVGVWGDLRPRIQTGGKGLRISPHV